jgi:acetylornithine deacetylase/succinyl-diaminopimelate desuccinylase-like protein
MAGGVAGDRSVYNYGAGAAFDWKKLEGEAATLLSRYIQINTTDPPGNEIKAAEFLKEILDREGIEAKIIESAPDSGNVPGEFKFWHSRDVRDRGVAHDLRDDNYFLTLSHGERARVRVTPQNSPSAALRRPP